MSQYEETNEDRRVRRLYKSYFKQEMDRPEIRKDKKEFIQQYFETKPLIFLRREFAVPALSFALVLILILPFAWQFFSPKAPVVKTFGPPTYEQYLRTNVDVRRVSSEMGPTMIYRKIYKEDPITIIWVFAAKPGKE